MKVKYEGGSAAVIVERVGRVERGSTIEVDDKLGERLVEQGWKKVSGGKKASSGRKASSRSRKKASTDKASTPETSSSTPPPASPAGDQQAA